MNRLLFITSGYMPVDNQKGGAIGQLLQIYFKHNDSTNNSQIVAYSGYDEDDIPDKNIYKNVEFRNIYVHKTFFQKITNRINLAVFRAMKKPTARPYIRKVIQDLKKRNELGAFDLIIIENCVDDLVWIKEHLKTSTPIVLHLHNDYLSKMHPDAKGITSFLTQIWCVSDYIRKQVTDINPQKVSAITIYNAINSKEITRKLSVSLKKELCNKLELKKDDYVFIYTGRIMQEKGVLPLIKAFEVFNQKIPNTKLLIIGGKKTDHKNDTYYDSVKIECENNPNIHFLGRIPHDELYQYYQISNCQVIPSICQEAFGLIALEGMMNNLEIISTGTGGLPEVLGDYDIRIKDTSIFEIKKAMQVAYSRKNKLADRKNNADEFSIDNYVGALDRAIKSLIHSELPKKQNPLVSVIIPTYNRSELVDDAIKSVLKQTYKNIEIIVIDDNANNPEQRLKTESIVKKYSDIKFIKNKENIGGALTRNVGIEAARGDFIAFLDDDDLYMPQKIEKQLDLYYKSADKNLGLIICNKARVDFSKKLINQNMKKIIASTSTWLMPKTIITSIGMFEDTPCEQDTIVLLKLLGAGYNISIVEDELTVFRPHDIGNGISGFKEKNIVGYKNLINWSRKYYNLLTKREISDVEYHFNRKLVSMYAYNGRKKKAFTHFLRMVQNQPYMVIANVKALAKILFSNSYSSIHNKKITRQNKKGTKND